MGVEVQAITPDEVRTARQAWAAAVEALSVEMVLARYAPDAWLLGTLDTASTDRRQSVHRLREYFEMFLGCDSIEVRFHRTVTVDDLLQLGPGVAAYSGYYDFRVKRGAVEQTAHGKFTFVYRRREDGGLAIVMHNSGLTPEGIVEG